MADTPEPDRIEGAPHPRDTLRLFGHEGAEHAFLDAFAQDRLHHGWLIHGPRGIGKATLAWRLARFLLATEPGGGLFGAPDTLDIDPEHPTARHITAGSEPRLLAIKRGTDEKTGRLRSQITVDEVRKLRDFFGLSATDGGRRVVIVDAADDMNASAANAILKLLEEPPRDAVLLLVAHQPSALLPTIRSRCRSLRLSPLDDSAMARALEQATGEPAEDAGMAQLSGGSVGEAIRMAAGDGAQIYAQILSLLGGLPRLDRPALRKLADSVTLRDEARFDLIVRLFDLALARAALNGARGQPLPQAAPGEQGVLARLAPDPHRARLIANQAAELGARARAARAVNLDPGALVLDMFLRLEASVQRLPA